ncbi:MAG: NAD(P)-dependent alcohol dehydrogenase [Acidimicrobiales bacterium]|nr:NAD(P)-dependent alcohol dehydrogenase [Acidimicrobiales bacterium]
MKAAVQERYGIDAIRVQERPVPEPGPDQVRVRIDAASINPADWHKATGTPGMIRTSEGFRRPKAEIIGTDAAGTIDAVGTNITDFEIDERVFGKVQGAFAEFALAPAAGLVRIPDGVPMADAAGLPIAGVTALQGVEKGDVGGKRVVISGASGGVGTYAVQIARAMGAAHITGVCSGRNTELVRSLGADDVIDYTTDDWTTKGPYDVLLDLAGTRRFADVKLALNPGGRWIMIGPDSKDGLLGPIPQIVGLMARAKFSPIDMSVFVAEETAERLQALADLYSAGSIRTVIDRSYKLDEVVEAYRYLETRRARGKVVIAIS